MISAQNNTIIDIYGKSHQIGKTEVGYQTPKGITKNLTTAVEVCQSCDFDPDLTIRPIVLVIAEDDENVYEVWS